MRLTASINPTKLNEPAKPPGAVPYDHVSRDSEPLLRVKKPVDVSLGTHKGRTIIAAPSRTAVITYAKDFFTAPPSILIKLSEIFKTTF